MREPALSGAILLLGRFVLGAGESFIITKNGRPVARILGIVLSVFDLILVPIGTIVGAYGLFVLFSKDAERLFAATPVTAPPPVQ